MNRYGRVGCAIEQEDGDAAHFGQPLSEDRDLLGDVAHVVAEEIHHRLDERPLQGRVHHAPHEEGPQPLRQGEVGVALEEHGRYVDVIEDAGVVLPVDPLRPEFLQILQRLNPFLENREGRLQAFGEHVRVAQPAETPDPLTVADEERLGHQTPFADAQQVSALDR